MTAVAVQPFVSLGAPCRPQGPSRRRGQPLACFGERRADKLKRGFQIQRPVSDDAELLQRIRNGAQEEFAELVRRHQSHVFAILYRYERDHHRLEDLAQDTFLKAWRSLGQFDGRAPFQHWLSKIAVHAALDHLRKQKRSQKEIGFPELGEDALDWLHNDNKQSDLDANQAREILRRRDAKTFARRSTRAHAAGNRGPQREGNQRAHRLVRGDGARARIARPGAIEKSFRRIGEK